MTHQPSFSQAEFATKKKITRREKFLARKRGVIQAMAEGAAKAALQAAEKHKASVRAFVEHPFHIVKNIFCHRKVRYRGLAKNRHQLDTLFGLATS